MIVTGPVAGPHAPHPTARPDRIPAWAREAGRWLPPVLAAILLAAAVFGCTSEIEPDTESEPPLERLVAAGALSGRAPRLIGRDPRR